MAAQSDGDTDESVETSEHVYGEVTSVNADAKTEKTADEEKTSSKRAESTETEGFFADARLKKQAARDEALSLLKDTLSSGDASESAKEEATQKISAIASNSVKETKIENLIVGKGFSDAVVMMEEGSVTASVAGSNGALTETDVAKIADIIVGETGADLTTIRINDANGG